jgi:hypothetical protein
MDIVIARYKENLSWTKHIPDNYRVFVYNKEPLFYVGKYNTRIPAPQVIIDHPNTTLTRLPNVGREADTYLTHIIDRYDELADVTVFAQGDPFPHSPDFLKLLSLHEKFKAIQSLTDRYLEDIPPPKILEEHQEQHIDGARVCAYPMCFTNYQTVWFNDPGSFVVVKDFMDFHKVPNGTNVVEYVLRKAGFDVKDVPFIGDFCYAAMFAVHKDKIRRHPKQAYENLRKLNNEGNRLAASVLERIWLYLFSM